MNIIKMTYGHTIVVNRVVSVVQFGTGCLLCQGRGKSIMYMVMIYPAILIQ